jgi:hypothetical protein
MVLSELSVLYHNILKPPLIKHMERFNAIKASSQLGEQMHRDVPELQIQPLELCKAFYWLDQNMAVPLPARTLEWLNLLGIMYRGESNRRWYLES